MMKTIRVIIFMLILSLFFSCKRCPPSSSDPKEPVFCFTITDEDGNDLFFGENSIYDPHSVKVTAAQEESQQSHLIVGEMSFALWIDEGKTSILYVEFVPNRTDTIKIESQFMYWYEEHKGCKLWGVYKNVIYFNDVPVCSENCIDSKIFKISII